MLLDYKSIAFDDPRARPAAEDHASHLSPPPPSYHTTVQSIALPSPTTTVARTSERVAATSTLRRPPPAEAVAGPSSYLVAGPSSRPYIPTTTTTPALIPSSSSSNVRCTRFVPPLLSPSPRQSSPVMTIPPARDVEYAQTLPRPPTLASATHSSHVSFYARKEPLVLAHVIDLNFRIPASLLQQSKSRKKRDQPHEGEFTEGPNTVRVHGFWKSRDRKVDLRLGIQGKIEDGPSQAQVQHQRKTGTGILSGRGGKQLPLIRGPRERVHIYACSRSAPVAVSVVERSPPDQPFSIRLVSKKTGGTTLLVPRDFRGPVLIACVSGAPPKLSIEISRRLTPINGSDPKRPLYFLGPLPVSSSDWSHSILSPSSSSNSFSAVINASHLGSLDSASLEVGGKGLVEIRYADEVVVEKKSMWKALLGRLDGGGCGVEAADGVVFGGEGKARNVAANHLAMPIE